MGRTAVVEVHSRCTVSQCICCFPVSKGAATKACCGFSEALGDLSVIYSGSGKSFLILNSKLNWVFSDCGEDREHC